MTKSCSCYVIGPGRSWVIVCHSREIGKDIIITVIMLLSHGTVLGYWMWWGNRARLWLHLSRLCQLRIIHCVDGSQVIDLLSWAQTCLWEREDLLPSCHGFRLFLDRLLGVSIRRRSKHHTETGSQVLGAWSPSLDGDLDPLTGVERVGLVCV
jgi:hypothetical protein